MGSLVDNEPREAAFDGQVHKKGMDLKRCRILTDPGTGVALAGSTIRAGQLVSRNASGFYIGATGVDVAGFAKWGKENLGISIKVDEVHVVSAGSTVDLNEENVAQVSVRTAVNMGGTLITAAGDYAVVAGAGQLTWVGSPAEVADGQTVYVTYIYSLIESDFDFDGRTFRNQNNDFVTGGENRIAIIENWARIYTMEWDTDSDTSYALAGAASNLRCTADGKVSNDTGITANDFVGKCYQLPSADDPYMGLTATGIVSAQ